MSYRAWSVVYGEQPSASKWNILGTNDDHFYQFLGGSNAMQTYTPTITNLSGANNTILGRYVRIGNMIYGSVKVTLGSGFSIAGSMRASVPVASRLPYGGNVRGGYIHSLYYDVGGSEYLGTGRMETTTAILLLATTVNGANYTGIAGVTSSSPFTWVAGDNFAVEYFYEGVEA